MCHSASDDDFTNFLFSSTNRKACVLFGGRGKRDLGGIGFGRERKGEEGEGGGEWLGCFFADHSSKLLLDMDAYPSHVTNS